MTKALSGQRMVKGTTDRDRARRLAPIQLAVGATMISFSAVFAKWVHVGPTTAGFYRMLFGAIILTALVLIRKEMLFFGTLHFLKEIAGKGFSDLESKKPCSGLRFVVCFHLPKGP